MTFGCNSFISADALNKLVTQQTPKKKRTKRKAENTPGRKKRFQMRDTPVKKKSQTNKK